MKNLTIIATLGAALAVFSTPAQAEEVDVHVVQEGDTFWELAQDNDIPVGDVVELNADKDAMNLQVGSTILLPGGSIPESITVEPVAVESEPVIVPIKVERTATVNSVWDTIAECESGGDWSIDTGNGFYGGAQFTLESWNAMGGQEFSAYPNQASKAEQIVVAERLQAVQGWGAWPVCSAKAGLR